nr:MAG TPA: hypothetical protein [Herelleviridae sp.]
MERFVSPKAFLYALYCAIKSTRDAFILEKV